MNLKIEQLNPLVINVGHAVHHADWNWINVHSPFMRIFYVLEGTAKVILPNVTLTLTPGNLYYIPSFTRHSYECDSLFSLYYIHLYEDSEYEEVIEDYWELPNEIQSEPIDPLIIRRLIELNPKMSLSLSDPTTYDNESTLLQNIIRNKTREFDNKLESRGIILQLLSRFIKHAKLTSANQDDRIHKAIRYINKNINSSFDLAEIAFECSISKDHFIRLFKQTTGITPWQYIINRKIKKAQLMLLTENLSIKDIAFGLAFDDYSYFIRTFKKITGITPLEYRKVSDSKRKVISE